MRSRLARDNTLFRIHLRRALLPDILTFVCRIKAIISSISQPSKVGLSPKIVTYPKTGLRVVPTDLRKDLRQSSPEGLLGLFAELAVLFLSGTGRHRGR